MKTLTVLVAALLAVSTFKAEAALVRWTFEDTSYNLQGPGTISGSFLFDTDSREYSDVRVTVANTGSSTFDGLYEVIFPPATSIAAFSLFKDGPLSSGSPIIQVRWTRPLFVSVPVGVAFTQAGICGDENCGFIEPGAPRRFGDTGSLTPTPIPIPASALLLLGAILGTLGIRRIKENTG